MHKVLKIGISVVHNKAPNQMSNFIKKCFHSKHWKQKHRQESHFLELSLEWYTSPTHTQEAKGAASASKVYLLIHMVAILRTFDFKNSPSIC